MPEIMKMEIANAGSYERFLPYFADHIWPANPILAGFPEKYEVGCRGRMGFPSAASSTAMARRDNGTVR